MGTATVSITGNSASTYLPSPRFDKSLYQGSLSATNALTIENPTILEDTFSDDIQFTFFEGYLIKCALGFEK